MVALTGMKEQPALVRIEPTRTHRWLGIALVTLGVGLIAN